MLQILQSTLDLALGLLGSLWGVVSLVAVWGWEVLYHLHVSAPRLEGLLVGITLAWVLLRRDKHPLLRVLSAPLKLVLDILDLAWDQVTEVSGDLWGTAVGWWKGSLGWVKGKLVASWNWMMGLLGGLRDKLSRKKAE